MIVEDIALTLVRGLGPKGAAHLLHCFGSAAAVFAAGKEELVARAELRADIADEIVRGNAFRQAEAEAAYCRRHGIEALASTDEAYPKLLGECNDFPHVLYVLGNRELMRRPMLSMVGTRRMTAYGRRMCGELVAGLARRMPELVIVSGLAFGVDVTCHRAAMDHGLATVGVLPCALPGVVPPTHREVAREMLSRGGALVTECHSQSKQNGSFYIARNRIIAGMSGGTVVVESPAAGGSMFTAQFADGYDRVVMAVPGRAGDSTSEGPNHLIKMQKARLVCSADDILREMMWDLSLPQVEASQVRRMEVLGREERELLERFGEGESPSVDELAAATGCSVSEVSARLFGLEMAGVVRTVPGGRYERTMRWK
ncbi:MAG: DNA-processing protein DprA [Rikenellaceae bacterium]|nr:DNA-processing protein DprA [Rikenellaceae bacterium]